MPLPMLSESSQWHCRSHPHAFGTCSCKPRRKQHTMKPSPFDYIRADTCSEALEVLAGSGQDTKVLAGGQSLLPLLNMRLARPSVVLDINHIPDLDGLEMGSSGQASETLTIGALVRQRTLERRAAQHVNLRLMHTALTNIGHPQTRNRGTVGGSLVHGDASAELPLILV